MKNIMYVVENGVTGEFMGWFYTEISANAYRTAIESRNELLIGHHTIRESIQNNSN
tara:strand:+ start:2210 stop:2377 length:168 start_codon:yes stop_codon:yes gene_type:complete